MITVSSAAVHAPPSATPPRARAEVFVARRHCGIDSEEAAEIDLTIGFDLKAFEGDSAHRTLR
jgi:hypothetical protein